MGKCNREKVGVFAGDDEIRNGFDAIRERLENEEREAFENVEAIFQECRKIEEVKNDVFRLIFSELDLRGTPYLEHFENLKNAVQRISNQVRRCRVDRLERSLKVGRVVWRYFD